MLFKEFVLDKEQQNKTKPKEIKLSNCCGSLPITPESDICLKCGEHAEFLTEEELENN